MKKNGFTLVELLAVITIIGLLAVIIIPKVKDTLSESKKSANEVSTSALVRAATNYYLEKRADKSFVSCAYDFASNSNTCDGFSFSGEKPEGGRLEIKKNGTVAVAVWFDKYCYIKGFNNEDIQVIDYDSSTCGRNAYVFTNYDMPETVTSGDGLYVSSIESDRYIYRGANPNNYIKIKENGVDTLYRIISFESDGTIKVIRNESIGNMAWDGANLRKNTSNTYCTSEYGCNVWSNTDKTYYDGNSLTSLNASTFNFKYFDTSTAVNLKNHPNSGSVTTEASLNTYLNGTWLASIGLDNYIYNHDFNVGGLYYYNGYNGGDKGLVKEKQEISAYKWNGKIGLMDVTDMVEASMSTTCTSVWSNYYYNRNNVTVTKNESNQDVYTANYASGQWPCALNNWMYSGVTEWSLSAFSSARHSVWRVGDTGYFDRNGAFYTSFRARPVFYLKSSIGLNGTGSYSDPYEIVME